MQYIIGVDIGGTNTDAVLINAEEEILSAIKVTTTDPVSEGLCQALKGLLLQTGIQPSCIQMICMGTTQATNALLQRDRLYRVGAIRIAGHRPDLLPVAFDWPTDLQAQVLTGEETIGGGFECHGGTLTLFDPNEAADAIQRLLIKNCQSFAVVGVFSPLNGDQEKQVAELIQRVAGPDFPISLSHQIGGMGFIERENSTLLNAALKQVMHQGFVQIQSQIRAIGIAAPLMITQNDGSLISLEHAIEYPVLTIASGPTNSFIGGARLARHDSALVVDIGGTSTDVGLVRQKFPLRSINTSNIGGISLNFPMPDLLSIAIGGGSLITERGGKIIIGPKSVAKALQTEAISFGGSQLTLTDVALALNHLQMPGARPTDLSFIKGKAVFQTVLSQIDQCIAKMRGEYQDLPVVYVGGGAALLPPSLYCIPRYFDIANAYGAALAEIAGSIDTSVSLQNREETLKVLHARARWSAIDQGADPQSVRLIDQQIIPYAYMPNQMARVILRYAGKRSPLALRDKALENKL